MKNIKLTIPNDGDVIDTGTILSVSWELSLFEDFKVEEHIIGRVLDSKTDKLSTTIVIDENKLVSNKLFFRYRITNNDKSLGKWSEPITQTIPDYDESMNASVVELPTAVVTITYTDDVDNVKGKLSISTSPFRDYAGITSHNRTVCKVLDRTGATLAEITHDTENGLDLQRFDVDTELFNDDEIYTFNITYYGANGVKSPTLNHLFESYLMNDVSNTTSDYVSGNAVGDVKKGKLAVFKVEPKTTDFKHVNLYLVNHETKEVVNEELYQKTVYPKMMIPDTGILEDGSTYDVMASVATNDGFDSAKVILLSTTIEDNLIRIIDVNSTYSDKYSYMGKIANSELSIASSEQLPNGYILIPNSDTLTLDSYRIVNGELVFNKKSISFPETDELSMLDVSVNRMYDDGILVNYTNKNVSGAGEQVFSKYIYDVSLDVYSKVKEVRVPNMDKSCGYSSSVFVDASDNIFFIPGSEGDGDALSMYKLEKDTFNFSKVSDLPFTASRHVSIAPTVDKNKFIVLNGSVSSEIVDGVVTWKRDNDKIYTYNTKTDEYAEESYTMETIPDDFYNLQSYLRRDGKVVLFNSSNSGTSIDNQNTIVIDLENGTVNVTNNDLPDDLIYRSTVTLTNGEFLRLGSNVEDEHVVYKYVGEDVGDIVEPIVATRNTVLTVEHNETITVDNLALYSKIFINGTDESNTGTLLSIDKVLPGTFDYRTLIISNDTELTQAEADDYETIEVINDSALTIVG